MTRMNPTIKAKWVDALRSGKYKQGQGALKRLKGGEEEHCCLGVLCEVAIGDGIPLVQKSENFPSGMKRVIFDGRYAFLPPAVLDWSGLDSGAPDVVVPDETDPERMNEVGLHNLNDSGNDFNTIADLIEEQF